MFEREFELEKEMDMEIEMKLSTRRFKCLPDTNQCVNESGPSLPALLFLLLTALAVFGQTGHAYPSGAPDSACKTLKPGHGVEPATGNSPFELSQDKLQVEAGDQVKGKY